MLNYSTIAFDVGGTLLRFNLDGLTRAYMDAGAALGISLDSARARAVLAALENDLPRWQKGRPISLEPDNGRSFWEEFYTEGFRRLGVTCDVSRAAATIRERFQRAEFEMLFDDVIPALDALKAQGKRLGILSNFSPNLENVLRQLGIHRYFTFFIVSAIVGVEKPEAQVFDLMVQAANCSRTEVVYVGDSIYHDVEGAQRAGVAAILVDRENQHPNFVGTRIRGLCELAG